MGSSSPQSSRVPHPEFWALVRHSERRTAEQVPKTWGSGDESDGPLDEVRGVVREPVDAGVLAEQPVLAAGELPGARDGGLARPILGRLARQVGENLLIAQCLARGEAFAET